MHRNFKKLGKLTADEFINRFTMIVGEINSGKSTLTQQILQVLWRTTESIITVVDLAPEITPQDLESSNQTMAIGGALQTSHSKRVRYFHPRIYPPRLRAKNESEAEALAAENLRTIDALLDKAMLEDTDALFINDCSLYLHSGRAAKLLDVIHSCPTAVVNGYLGRFFSNNSISIRERNGMNFLMRHCDRLIKMT